MPELIRPGWPAPACVHAFTTTRVGGVSTGPWHSFNLGENCGDAAVDVAENRRILRRFLPAEPRWLKQVHGSTVVEHPGPDEPLAAADAIYSDRAGRVCTVLTADCLPVLFCDRSGSHVAAAHAGWRGLATGVLEATVAAMGVKPDEIIAWVGPGIGRRAYEVGGEVRDAFVSVDAAADEAFTICGNRWLADLPLLARQRLGCVGVNHVYGGSFCTLSDADRFYSHRRDGVGGRMATVIWRD